MTDHHVLELCWAAGFALLVEAARRTGHLIRAWRWFHRKLEPEGTYGRHGVPPITFEYKPPPYVKDLVTKTERETFEAPGGLVAVDSLSNTAIEHALRAAAVKAGERKLKLPEEAMSGRTGERKQEAKVEDYGRTLALSALAPPAYGHFLSGGYVPSFDPQRYLREVEALQRAGYIGPLGSGSPRRSARGVRIERGDDVGGTGGDAGGSDSSA